LGVFTAEWYSHPPKVSDKALQVNDKQPLPLRIILATLPCGQPVVALEYFSGARGHPRPCPHFLGITACRARCRCPSLHGKVMHKCRAGATQADASGKSALFTAISVNLLFYRVFYPRDWGRPSS